MDGIDRVPEGLEDASSPEVVKPSIVRQKAGMDGFAALAMTARCDSAISPRVFRARFCQTRWPFEEEGAGNAGRSMRPQPGGQKNKPHQ
jgi:hypothetical protein